MSDYFEKEINTAYACHTLKLVSVDKDRHLNVVVKDNHGQLGATLNIFGIKELRDTLNELFPPEPEKQPYEVTAGWENSPNYNPLAPAQQGLTRAVWWVVQKEPSLKETIVATATTEERAKRIAQALNEAEGL